MLSSDVDSLVISWIADGSKRKCIEDGTFDDRGRGSATVVGGKWERLARRGYSQRSDPEAGGQGDFCTISVGLEAMEALRVIP